MGQGRGQFPVKVNSLDSTGNGRECIQNVERLLLRKLSLLEKRKRYI